MGREWCVSKQSCKDIWFHVDKLSSAHVSEAQLLE